MTAKTKIKFETDLLDNSKFELVSSEVKTFKHASSGHVSKIKGHEFTFKNKENKLCYTLTLEPTGFSHSPFRWFVYGDIVELLNGRRSFHETNLTRVFNGLKK
jgi:hypothetical protein